MHRTALIVVLTLALAGCAVTPTPSTATLPAGAFGSNADNDIMAINTAAWAFANPARTRGNLINAIHAVMAIDYLAGELTASPRWNTMSPLTKLEMLRARTEVRAAVGIAPDAPSQAVVNALLALAANPTQETATRVLTPPVFTLPPKQILARLDDLPYLPIAARASYMASAQEFPSNDFQCFNCN
ncbi:MAG: hypothetical protein M0002_01590 [Rhodospirillales bacterium]|nr:hypothetical protein [Rhodospirillales bacterium]